MLINAPAQLPKENRDIARKTVFFQIGNKNIDDNMHSWTSFIFTDNFLTHQQICNKICLLDDDVFVNLALYGNQGLYTHITTLFLRV